MTGLIEAKLITAILPKGVSLDVVKKLREEKGVNTANFNYARGTGKLTPLKYSGGVVESEKEILTVIVDAARSEEIFAFVYQQSGVNQPHGGLMFMHSLMRSTAYLLPDLSEEV
jgi:hypothetical protein